MSRRSRQADAHARQAEERDRFRAILVRHEEDNAPMPTEADSQAAELRRQIWRIDGQGTLYDVSASRGRVIIAFDDSAWFRLRDPVMAIRVLRSIDADQCAVRFRWPHQALEMAFTYELQPAEYLRDNCP